ncbi:histidine kinase [Labilithrix luteola]|uniref:histidine kinase n=1 Tax=Labilithrix luteola TaxID=1391654 RepID=A0A0K1QEA2_9BACT|nr:HAMP domain-containing sensor histidine kinase [Labilithrix luteola]AKV03997.1 histidine kinase [Labilithrix luteola]
MGRRPFSPAKWLAFVVPLIVVVFVASHVLSVSAAGDLRGHAGRIERLGRRSQALSLVRGDLHRMGMSLGQAEQGDRFDRSRFDALRASMDANLLRLRIQTEPAEREQSALERDVEQDVRRAEETMERVATLLDAGDVRGATQIPSRKAVFDAEGTIERLTARQLEDAERESERIEDTDGRIKRVSTVLDGVAAGFASVLLVLAVNAARRHARLSEQASRLAEERAAELEIFAGRVAHDLRNPLANIALRAESGQKRFADQPNVVDEFARTANTADRMDRIIDGLLAFARAGGHPETNPSSVVCNVLSEVANDFVVEAERAHVELVVEPCPATFVACPEGPLSSIVGNLMRNAIKFVVDGPTSERRVVVRTALVGDRVRIQVEDTGPGIPTGMEQTIFEPFVRAPMSRARPGLGLGLATVKRLVEAYRGTVTVRSGAAGLGTCFEVELPTATEA